MSNWNIGVGSPVPRSMFSGTGRSWQERCTSYISTAVSTSQPPSTPTSLPEVTSRHFSSFNIINCRHSVCRAAPSQQTGLHHPHITPCHRDNTPDYPLSSSFYFQFPGDFWETWLELNSHFSWFLVEFLLILEPSRWGGSHLFNAKRNLWWEFQFSKIWQMGTNKKSSAG